MTSLQLARAIAEAARNASNLAAARAVLDVLHANHVWFCRLYETTDGVHAELQMEGMPPLPRAPLPLEEDLPLPFGEPE